MMNKYKNKLVILSIIGLLFSSFLLFTNQIHAQTNNVEITIFSRKECTHCHQALNYFKTLKEKFPNIVVNEKKLEIKSNYDAFIQFTDLLKLPKITPIIQVGNQVLPGFGDSYKEKIEKVINKCSTGKKCPNFEEFNKQQINLDIADVNPDFACSEDDVMCKIDEDGLSNTIEIPFLGTISLKNFSLPIISVILGFIDGFNPCAMWVLIMFLSLLIQTGSKKKMWQVAGLFIFAESIMYYLILNVWFTTWDFVGLDRIVTPIIAIIAIGAGLYFLYEYIKVPAGVCNITSLERQNKTKEKIAKVISKPMNLLTALGIIGIAFSVNIIEFACSIGIPQTFTKILELNDLSFIKEQLYMAIYIFFYMIDDLVVFGIALYSFEKIGLTQKYSKICQLLGGILMIILGLILIFKREWLVF